MSQTPKHSIHAKSIEHPQRKRVLVKTLPNGRREVVKKQFYKERRDSQESNPQHKSEINFYTSNKEEQFSPFKTQTTTTSEYMKNYTQPAFVDQQIFDSNVLNSYRNHIVKLPDQIENHTTNKHDYKLYDVSPRLRQLVEPTPKQPVIYKTSTYNSNFFYCPVGPMPTMKESPKAAVLPFVLSKQTTYNKDFKQTKNERVHTISNRRKLKLGSHDIRYERKSLSPIDLVLQEKPQKKPDTLFSFKTPVYQNQFCTEIQRNYQRRRIYSPTQIIRNDPKIKICLG